MSGQSEGSPADPSESNGVIQDLLLEQLQGMIGCRYQNLEGLMEVQKSWNLLPSDKTQLDEKTVGKSPDF